MNNIVHLEAERRLRRPVGSEALLVTTGHIVDATGAFETSPVDLAKDHGIDDLATALGLDLDSLP